MFAIYYVLKSTVIYTRARMKYLKSLSDISEIVKDEPVVKEAKKRNEEPIVEIEVQKKVDKEEKKQKTKSVKEKKKSKDKNVKKENQEEEIQDENEKSEKEHNTEGKSKKKQTTKKKSKIKFATIINIMNNKEIIPECLLEDCNSKNIYDKVNNLLNNPNLRKEQVENNLKTISILGYKRNNNSGNIIAKKIEELCE